MMMNKMKSLAGILALSMLLAGCSDNADSTADASSDVAAAKQTSAVSTDASSKASDDFQWTVFDESDKGKGIVNIHVNDGAEPEEPASAEEQKAVEDVVKLFAKATLENDYDTLVDISDLDVVYRVCYDEELTKEEQRALLTHEDADSDVTVAQVPYIDVQVSKPVCYHSLAKQYNDALTTIAQMDAEDPNAVTVPYQIDGVYQFTTKLITDSASTENSENGISTSVSIGSGSSTVDYYVFRINGEWKVDLGQLGILASFASSIGDESEFTME